MSEVRTDDIGVSDDAVVVEMTYPQSIKQVWKALTESEKIAEWLMPNDFQPRVGHRFTFTSLPQHMWSGTVYCEVVEVDPPSRLAYTWQGGNLPTTLVTFTLKSVPTGTELKLVHSGFASGGKASATIRDILGSGWRSKVLVTRLPETLRRMSEESATQSDALDPIGNAR